VDEAVGERNTPTGEELLGALRAIELRCREYGAGLPAEERAPEIWAGVLFVVGDARFLAPLEAVCELLEVPRDITLVPGAKPWVVGVANNRGTLLPIFDLQAFLFGASSGRSPRQRVLVVRQGELPLGLLVGEVIGIRHFESSARRSEAPAPGPGMDELLTGGFLLGSETCPVFEPGRLRGDPRFALAAA
jgi:twitching motility protein PilI